MKKYLVALPEQERPQLRAVVKKGRAAARTRLHAPILLHAATEGAAWTEEAIREALNVHPTTVANIRQRFVGEDWDAALHRRRTQTCRRKLDGKQEAPLIALACSDAPAGRAR